MRKLLSGSRFLLVLPVIGSLLLMVGIVVMGLGVVLTQGWDLLRQGEFSSKGSKQLTLTVIESIDMFLVGAICYIVAVGLYKLFIGQEEEQILKRVKIDKLADLENKIIGVVVVAMAVGFLGKATEAVNALAVLQGGVGVAVVIVALCLFLKISTKTDE
ncbi:MAG: YqhA family protein [Gemmataceae bacterium]